MSNILLIELFLQLSNVNEVFHYNLTGALNIEVIFLCYRGFFADYLLLHRFIPLRIIIVNPLSDTPNLLMLLHEEVALMVLNLLIDVLRLACVLAHQVFGISKVYFQVPVVNFESVFQHSFVQ